MTYIKGSVIVSRMPADGCLSGPSCALCLWRRDGAHQVPLTVPEWVRVLRENAA